MPVGWATRGSGRCVPRHVSTFGHTHFLPVLGEQRRSSSSTKYHMKTLDGIRCYVLSCTNQGHDRFFTKARFASTLLFRCSGPLLLCFREHPHPWCLFRNQAQLVVEYRTACLIGRCIVVPRDLVELLGLSQLVVDTHLSIVCFELPCWRCFGASLWSGGSSTPDGGGGSRAGSLREAAADGGRLPGRRCCR